VGVQGPETLLYFKAHEPDTYAIVGEPFTTALVGIPFLKTEDCAALHVAVKAVLDAMQADGSYDAILAKYELQGNTRRPITENMGQ
jgi:polar amino acid transport system substrate-binding protein